MGLVVAGDQANPDVDVLDKEGNYEAATDLGCCSNPETKAVAYTPWVGDFEENSTEGMVHFCLEWSHDQDQRETRLAPSQEPPEAATKQRRNE